MDNEAAVALIKRAYEAVRGADLPEELHSGALSAILPFLAESPATAKMPEPRAGATGEHAAHDRAGQSLLDRIVSRLGLDAPLLEAVYEELDGDLHLVLSPALLDEKARPAMRQLALLVCAGRQAAGLDNGNTPISVLRGVLAQYPAHFDERNLYNALNGVESLRRTGERDNLSFRALPAAYNELAKLVRELATPATK